MSCNIDLTNFLWHYASLGCRLWNCFCCCCACSDVLKCTVLEISCTDSTLWVTTSTATMISLQWHLVLLSKEVDTVLLKSHKYTSIHICVCVYVCLYIYIKKSWSKLVVLGFLKWTPTEYKKYYLLKNLANISPAFQRMSVDRRQWLCYQA